MAKKNQQQRPILLSVVQYADELEAGQMTMIDVVNKAKTLSVSGVELRPEPWKNLPAELPAVRDRIQALELMVVFATTGTLFSDQAEEHLKRDIDSARALGSPFLRIFPGQVPAKQDDPKWTVAQKIVDYAATQGVVLALENFGAAPGNTLREIQTVLNRFNTMKTNVDMGNYATAGQDVVDAINALKDRIVYVHAKDASTQAPGAFALGEGTMPLKAIFEALDGLPQKVIYCFEFGGGGEPDARITRSLAFLKN